MQPATDKDRAVALAKLFEFARAFNVPNEHGKLAAGFYADALKILPLDLLQKAISAVTQHHEYGMRLPLPAEISGKVSDELSERIRVVGKLEQAQRDPVEPRENPPPTPEEIAKVDAIMAKWRGERGILVGPDPELADAERQAALLRSG